MKKIFSVLAVILCLAVSCQKYDDSQIRKDISDLREQVASLKAWCDNSQAAINAVAELKKAVENFNGVSYVETFSGDFGTGYNIVLDKDVLELEKTSKKDIFKTNVSSTWFEGRKVY